MAASPTRAQQGHVLRTAGGLGEKGGDVLRWHNDSAPVNSDAPDTVVLAGAAHEYDFVAGQQLPPFLLGTAIDVDGECLYLVRDAGYSLHWVTADGAVNAWEISGYDFDVVADAELDPFDDGIGFRAAATLTPGDLMFDDGEGTEGLYGTVTSVLLQPTGELEVNFDKAPQRAFLPGAPVRARRPETDTVYDPETRDYWANIDATQSSRTDEAMLAYIIEHESEDDFMVAAIRNPNVTAELIEKASQHHSEHVRRVAVFHPLVAADTLRRIKRQARAASKKYTKELAAGGVNPQSSHTQSMTATNDNLAAAASEQLARRAT